jgi:hypothetical protein
MFTLKGRAIDEVTSSPWLPLSDVPGTIEAPLELVIVYVVHCADALAAKPASASRPVAAEAAHIRLFFIL